MECPKCGYVMDAFTPECPRCARLSPPARGNQPLRRKTPPAPARKPFPLSSIVLGVAVMVGLAGVFVLFTPQISALLDTVGNVALPGKQAESQRPVDSFSIDFPAGWVQTVDDTPKSYMIFASSGAGVRFGVLVQKSARAFSPDSVYDSAVEMCQKRMTDAGIISSGSMTTTSGVPLQWFIYDDVTVSNGRARVINYTTCHGRMNYLISGIARTENFASVEPQLDRIAMTFRFK